MDPPSIWTGVSIVETIFDVPMDTPQFRARHWMSSSACDPMVSRSSQHGARPRGDCSQRPRWWTGAVQQQKIWTLAMPKSAFIQAKMGGFCGFYYFILFLLTNRELALLAMFGLWPAENGDDTRKKMSFDELAFWCVLTIDTKQGRGVPIAAQPYLQTLQISANCALPIINLTWNHP